MKTLKRTRAADALNLLLKDRRTTMPALQDDDTRTGKGPAAEPLQTLLGWMNGVSSLGLSLIGYVIDQQRYEDATGWWPGAKDYLERVAGFMDTLRTLWPREAAFLQSLPFSGPDLLYRLGRIKLLEIVVERGESLLGQFRSTLLVERADAMRMADTVMMEVELLLGRPTFTGAARDSFAELSQIPLSIWSNWQDRIAETARRNEKLRTDRQEEIEAAQRDAAAARATARLAAGQPVSDEDILSVRELGASPPPPPAPRRTRRR